MEGYKEYGSAWSGVPVRTRATRQLHVVHVLSRQTGEDAFRAPREADAAFQLLGEVFANTGDAKAVATSRCGVDMSAAAVGRLRRTQ